MTSSASSGHMAWMNITVGTAELAGLAVGTDPDGPGPGFMKPNAKGVIYPVSHVLLTAWSEFSLSGPGPGVGVHHRFNLVGAFRVLVYHDLRRSGVMSDVAVQFARMVGPVDGLVGLRSTPEGVSTMPVAVVGSPQFDRWDRWARRDSYVMVNPFAVNRDVRAFFMDVWSGREAQGV